MQYYVARMTSDQKQQIFSNKDYGMMSKCISAWIVMNPRLEQRDTVIIYEFAGRYQSGCGCDYPIKPCRNMEIIVINLGQNGEQKSKILGFLDLLFKKDIPVNERRDLLEADYSISLNENLMSKVNDMSESLGQEFLEGLKESQYDDGFYAGKAEGRAEGIAEGIVEGRAEGRAEAAIEHEARSVSLIMSKTGMSVTEAIEYMDVEERLRPLVKQRIENTSE